jgi:hypothetical protein
MHSRIGWLTRASRIAAGCFLIPVLACRSESSAATQGDSKSIGVGGVTKSSPVWLPTQQRLLYGRTQNGSEAYGWLVRLGHGDNGTFFVGDRPVKICSAIQSDTGLTFATAFDRGRSFRFAGKLMGTAIVGELTSAGPGAQTDEFGTARLVPLETGAASERLLDAHAGVYSNLFVHPESGDDLGSEVILFVAGGERVLLFQQAEGVKSLLAPGFDLKPAADTLSFSVGEPPDPRHLSLVFKRDTVLLRDAEDSRGGVESLPRGYSVEKFFDQPANGTCH